MAIYLTSKSINPRRHKKNRSTFLKGLAPIHVLVHERAFTVPYRRHHPAYSTVNCTKSSTNTYTRFGFTILCQESGSTLASSGIPLGVNHSTWKLLEVPWNLVICPMILLWALKCLKRYVPGRASAGTSHTMVA